MTTTVETAKDREDQMEELVRKLEDELWHPLTDPIKESILDYYQQNKDKVCHFIW